MTNYAVAKPSCSSRFCFALSNSLQKNQFSQSEEEEEMQQSPCINACKGISSSTCNQQQHRFPRLQIIGSSSTATTSTTFSLVHKFNSHPVVRCNSGNNRKFNSPGGGGGAKLKGGKENVWSVDNEMARAEKEKENMRRRRKKKGLGRMMNFNRKRNLDKVMVSGNMLMEVETVLQTQEPVIRPAWNTFASSVSGIWKGVGAVFSPITAEMEPIEIGSKEENLFDCYTLSRVELVPYTSGDQKGQVKRRINWVTLNPYGEVHQLNGGEYGHKEKSEHAGAPFSAKGSNRNLTNRALPKFESFDFGSSDVMEEDLMGIEPGLVFFEDGSYSRGPLNIPVGEFDESKYYLSPTFKFEQCLVKGCHKRLRIVHTIEFGNGGSDIQIMRVAVYEEQWVSPASIHDDSDMELDVQPFSQKKRVQPLELTGSWKVFEMSATPIYGDDDILTEESGGSPYVYLCTETLKKRSLPGNPVYFGEEEMLDMQDVTVLWLPGGVTGYVDVNKDGILCIGVGWYSDEGINLVMEREYGTDGKLRDVRWKSEMKRMWTNPPPM